MALKHGDYTKLAKYYVDRPGYSLNVIRALISYVIKKSKRLRVADVGAGTGKLTRQLIEFGLSGFAIEPNKAMFLEGKRLFKGKKSFVWRKGSAEKTGLSESSVDWVVMASSFHWANKNSALLEFFRIIKPGGYLTVMWNPRDIEKSDVEKWVEEKIGRIKPSVKRVSSGSAKNSKNWGEILVATDQFNNLIYMEGSHNELMTKERYINIWKSVNDIQVQLGFKKFKLLIDEIEKKIVHLEKIKVVYNTRAWTVQSAKT